MFADLNPEEIDGLLQMETIGHLACQQGGKPYVIPLAFYYHNGVLYGQTMEGRKTDILRQNPQVCFQVQQLQQDGWKSVLCWGNFEEIDLSAPMSPHLTEMLEQLSLRLNIVQHSIGVRVIFTPGQAPQARRPGEHGVIFRVIVNEKTDRKFTSERS